MNLFPVNLDIRGGKVVIVGGGTVAERKCRSLLAAEAAVTVVAPHLTAGLAELECAGRIEQLRRTYLSGDLAGALLVFAATGDRAVNRTVAGDARRSGIPVCVADAPEEGTFTSPSAVRRGDLLITVSTGGKSPALARRIRQEQEALYGPEYADIVDFLGELREKLLTTGRGGAYNNEFFSDLVAGDLSRLRDPALRDRLRLAITHSDHRRPPPPPDDKESP